MTDRTCVTRVRGGTLIGILISVPKKSVCVCSKIIILARVTWMKKERNPRNHSNDKALVIIIMEYKSSSRVSFEPELVIPIRTGLNDFDRFFFVLFCCFGGAGLS